MEGECSASKALGLVEKTRKQNVCDVGLIFLQQRGIGGLFLFFFLWFSGPCFITIMYIELMKGRSLYFQCMTYHTMKSFVKAMWKWLFFTEFLCLTLDAVLGET